VSAERDNANYTRFQNLAKIGHFDPAASPRPETPVYGFSQGAVKTAAAMKRKPTKQKAIPGPPRTDWGDVAGWYDALVGDAGSEYHREVVLPGVYRLLGPLYDGQRGLDVACGQGVLCRLLRDRGMEMTGIDAAAELISAARERGPADIHYHVGDAKDLGFLPEEHFDAASCVLAIQNIHPIQPVFDAVASRLKRGGRFVVAMMHPCFRGPHETSWGWDPAQGGVQYRRVDRYLLPRKTPITTHPGKDPGRYTWTFHKPIEAYAKALRRAGLLVDALEEWPSHKTSTSGPRAAAENVARKEIPMFLAIRALKLLAPTPTSDSDL
jgi:ubiquinone/menaquinone biosynthesis C-methylase UbiE